MSKFENDASYKYYQLTEDAYLHLCENNSGFMNLGLWPADSVQLAQRVLVENTLGIMKQSLSRTAELVVEAGSGWGAARPIVADIFPQAQYVGINCSERQIAYSRDKYACYQNTKYHHAFLENISDIILPPLHSALFAVEAALHVESKQRWIRDLRSLGFKSVVLAEICVESPSQVLAHPLFDPGLRFTWSVGRYVDEFSVAGATAVNVHEITDQVYGGWSRFLEMVDVKTFRGNKRVLRQFKESYSALARHAEAGDVKYAIIEGRFE